MSARVRRDADTCPPEARAAEDAMRGGSAAILDAAGRGRRRIADHLAIDTTQYGGAKGHEPEFAPRSDTTMSKPSRSGAARLARAALLTASLAALAAAPLAPPLMADEPREPERPERPERAAPPKPAKAPKPPRVETFVLSGEGTEPFVVVRDGEEGTLRRFVTSAKPRAYLGVGLVPMSAALRAHFGAPDDRGVLVDVVKEGSAAARAGLEVGDVIVDFEGEPIRDKGQIEALLFERQKGDEVTLRVIRKGRERDLRVSLDEVERPRINVGKVIMRTKEGEESAAAFEMERVFEGLELEGLTELERIEIAPLALDEKRLEAAIERLKSAEVRRELRRVAAEDAKRERERRALEAQLEALARQIEKLESRIEAEQRKKEAEVERERERREKKQERPRD